MNYLKNPVWIFTILFALFYVISDTHAQVEESNTFPRKKVSTKTPCNLYPSGKDACQLVSNAQFEDEDGNDTVIYLDSEGRNVLIAAPHGAIDYGTKSIVHGINNLSNQRWKSLIFFRFRKDNLRFNVNRPTLRIDPQFVNDGIPDYTQEVFNNNAKMVYNCFVNHAKDLISLNQMDFYVEIHGNANESRENYLDVAAHEGISAQTASLIQRAFQNALNARNIPLSVAMENTKQDPHYHGTASREYGFFCVLEMEDVPFLHIEIPYDYRNNTTNRNKMIQALHDALAEIQDDGLLD